MKALYLLPLVASFGMLQALSAKSQDVPICYMITATGQITDLSHVCSSKVKVKSKEEIFQQSLLQSADPKVQEYMQSHGGIARATYLAQKLCNYYNQGLSQQQAFEALDQDFITRGNSPQLQPQLRNFLTTVSTVGTPVYCPSP